MLNIRLEDMKVVGLKRRRDRARWRQLIPCGDP